MSIEIMLRTGKEPRSLGVARFSVSGWTGDEEAVRMARSIAPKGGELLVRQTLSRNSHYYAQRPAGAPVEIPTDWRTMRVQEHYGPGAHPGTGTPQEVHAGGGRTGASSNDDFELGWEQAAEMQKTGGWHSRVNPTGMEGYEGTVPAPKGATPWPRKLDGTLIGLNGYVGRPIWLGLKFGNQEQALSASERALAMLPPEQNEVAYVVKDGVIMFGITGIASSVPIGEKKDGWTDELTDKLQGSKITHLHPSGNGQLSSADMIFAYGMGAAIRTVISKSDDASNGWEFVPSTFGKKLDVSNLLSDSGADEGTLIMQESKRRLNEVLREAEGVDALIYQAVWASKGRTERVLDMQGGTSHLAADNPKLYGRAHRALASRMMRDSKQVPKVGRLEPTGPVHGLGWRDAFVLNHGEFEGVARFREFEGLLREGLPSMNRDNELNIELPKLIESEEKIFLGLDDRPEEERLRRYYGHQVPHTRGSGRTARPVKRQKLVQEGWMDDFSMSGTDLDVRMYQEAMAALLGSVGNLRKGALARVLAVLAALKQDLVEAILALDLTQGEGGSFQPFHMTALSQAVDRVMARFAQQYQLQQLHGLSQAAKVAQSLVPEALRQAGVQYVPVGMNMAQVEVAVLHSAKLVRYVTADIRRRVDNAILQAVLGKKSSFDVMKTIAAAVDLPQRVGPGFANNPLVQAETILRTEMGRIFSLAQRSQFLDLATRWSGLRKKWVHSGNPNQPRPFHKHVLNQQVVGINENFNVNGYPGWGPHDPDLPASETINCGCGLVILFPGQEEGDMPGSMEPDMDTRAARDAERDRIVGEWEARYGIEP